MVSVAIEQSELTYKDRTMIIRKKHGYKNRRHLKVNVSEKKSHTNERTVDSSITYVSQSEIDASIKILLKKYADTFRRLSE